MVGDRVRAGLGIGAAQLRHYRVRTALTVLAVALAVLATTLLAGVGIGVLETGTEKFAQTDQDLWVTAGGVRIQPGTVGGLENSILNAHDVADELARQDDVRVAAPLAFQTVYVGTDPDDLRTVVGVGVPNAGPRVLSVSEGERFSRGDVHYADGTYEGPITREVIIDPRAAKLFDVGVGDTLHIGGTIATARGNEYEVVGISSSFSQFLGAPSVTVHLSELQTLTGTAGTDRAALITIAIEDGASAESVAAELEAQYPEYRVRTNREQLRTVLESQAILLASATVLVLLAILAGVALTLNALGLLVYQQREAFAALKAGGVSSGTLYWTIIGQALLVGIAGGVVGLALTPIGVMVLNEVAAQVVGFEGLVQTRDWVYGVGAGIAIGIGLIGSSIAGWRLLRIRPRSVLQ